jgi:hypothetical protein
MLVCMVLYLIFFEFGIGTIVFIHIFETNVDSIISFSNQVLQMMVFTMSLITPTLITHLTVSGTFVFFGSWSLIGLIHMSFFIKDTTERIETDKNGNQSVVKLTEKEKKELYWPVEF